VERLRRAGEQDERQREERNLSSSHGTITSSIGRCHAERPLGWGLHMAPPVSSAPPVRHA
jgi:hypothetical protein